MTAIGAGVNRSAPLAELVRTCDLDVVLLAGRYTLLDQTALADLLPLCESRGVSVVIGGVFNSGILIDPVPGAHFNYLPAEQALLAKARAIREICDKHEVPLAAAAIQFPLVAPAGVHRAGGAADHRRARNGPVPVRGRDPAPALGRPTARGIAWRRRPDP